VTRWGWAQQIFSEQWPERQKRPQAIPWPKKWWAKLVVQAGFLQELTVNLG